MFNLITKLLKVVFRITMKFISLIIKDKKEKTIGQWLKEGLSQESYKNAKACNGYKSCFSWDCNAKSLSEAIWYGFYWDSMPEGYHFWNCKFLELQNKGL